MLNRIKLISLLIISFLLITQIPLWAEGLSAEQLLNLKAVSGAKLSPDGQHIAYTVRVPRTADDEAGGAYNELYVMNVRTKQTLPFITGKVHIGGVKWRPDGSGISFTTRRGGSKKNQVWFIPLKGGEARQLTDIETGISAYEWHPSGNRILFSATEMVSAREKALKKKGYGFIYYEENLKNKNLYCVKVLDNEVNSEAYQLTEGFTVWNFTFAPDGKSIAYTATDKNLIDQNYMFKEIYLLDTASKESRQLTQFAPRKIGNFKFSPDGKHLAISAALDKSDHASSQAFLLNVATTEVTNLTPENFPGHMRWVSWKDSKTMLVGAAEGMVNNLYAVSIKDGKRKQILSSVNNGGVTFYSIDFTKDFKSALIVGSTPQHPRELYYWKPGKKPQQLTHLSKALEAVDLGRQVVYKYKADDGQELEGLLIYPVGYQQGTKYPLVVLVHGGPEANYSNGWVTRYAEPGQVLAAKGFLVFYPNYRASTGYGLKFAKAGLNDPAGREFDDIRDGIVNLIDQGIADPDRVGLGGGSYGGYAAAWFATYYTKYIKAACMFVGISNLISKRGTTDIPYEEMYVHSVDPLEKMWKLSLERSPIYYAHQSKTATLIFGGAADPRVHPSQSMELYRRMKMNQHPAVRLVQYPGEGHGNRKQPGRIDVLYRILDWYDWYVKDLKALDGEMPPLDISDKYGIELPEGK